MVGAPERELVSHNGTRRVRRTVEDQRSLILLHSSLLIGGVVAATWGVSESLPRNWTADPALHLAISVTLVIAGSLLSLGATIFALKLFGRRRKRKAEAVASQASDVLTAIALGSGSIGSLRQLHHEAPDQIGALLANFLAVQGGAACRRLTDAAEAAGVAARWRRLATSLQPQTRCRAITSLGRLAGGVADAQLQTALSDREELVRVEAARGLLRSGSPEHAELVFAGFPAHSPFVRAMISPLLRRHALTLANTALPTALQSGDPSVVTAALDLIYDWKRALPLPHLPDLLTHPDQSVRSRAWRALPYALGVVIGPEEMPRALASEPAVRREAILAAGRMKIAAGDLIETAISGADLEVAAAAAASLAHLGRVYSLETIAISGRYPSAAIAAEALEKFRTGRLIQ